VGVGKIRLRVLALRASSGAWAKDLMQLNWRIGDLVCAS
jgi:hypothetical protein